MTTTIELIQAAAARAEAKWPAPWEGGNHLMRYIGAELRNAETQWKVSADEYVSGVKLNKNDAIAMVKIAGALYRFIEQVGAENMPD